jgi:apolipoprotein N-acyltransferase
VLSYYVSTWYHICVGLHNIKHIAIYFCRKLSKHSDMCTCSIFGEDCFTFWLLFVYHDVNSLFIWVTPLLNVILGTFMERYYWLCYVSSHEFHWPTLKHLMVDHVSLWLTIKYNHNWKTSNFPHIFTSQEHANLTT